MAKKKFLDCLDDEDIKEGIRKEVISELSAQQLRKLLEEKESGKSDKEIEDEITSWAKKEKTNKV